MKHQVKIEYELKSTGTRGILTPYYQSYVKAVDVYSGCSAKSSVTESPPTGKVLRELKEEAKEAVVAKVQEYYRAKEKALSEARILATEEFQIEI